MLTLSPDRTRVHVAATDQPFKLHYGRSLPHLGRPGAVYAVCFRLSDSLPATVASAWRRQRDEILATARQMGRPLSAAEQGELCRLFSEIVDASLDSGSGQCHLQRPYIAKIVRDALEYYDTEGYLLLNWVIMPNHVHAIVWPLPGQELDNALHRLKSFTAHAANRALNSTGAFWQEESYDHLVRDDGDLWHSIRYLDANPSKARLADRAWQDGVLMAADDGIRIRHDARSRVERAVRLWQAELGV